MTPTRTDVRSVYARNAPDYDRRWAGYLEATLPPTLEPLQLPPDARVLDLGCGTGALLERLRRHHPGAEAWGVDLSPDMLARAAERLGAGVGLVLSDAARLPFASDRFHAVVTSSVMHHWPEPDRVLAEAARVLRPGGQLVVTDWAADHLPTRLLAAWLRLVDPSHHHAYTLREARRLLERAGFAVVRARRYRLGLKWGFMTLSARRMDGAPRATQTPLTHPA